ncbi:NAD(P)-dependent oxidoreductase [Texcoconibacillus texcoconensis]|uniref:3-hydroxyisobutyrate dehydrogenase n=1 Tax=Texcoconibacillus texcoconensis TaxID=1095777 RepID=A0A840QS66_9BACI|nr:NAD(P)-dependent oxidoreductase [Texcoconibacillus texcoconensis]MBB5174141.1 3-hydroxyisobutyrate dehydrogenase [Texcoconibacillus texcoconensis]
MMSEGKTIGFIGTGVMGKSMASHLLKAGYSLLVYNRTPKKAEDLVQQGAVKKDTVAELAAKSDVVITMVGYPADVEEVYFGDEGIFANARKGTYLIDMTTSTPKLAKQIDERAKQEGMYALDAPVSGGDIGAKEARLAIMAGGDIKVFETMKPVLSVMGTNVVLQGEASSGQHTKMSNQIAVAGTMLGVSEAVAYAKTSGLDPERVLKSIETGAAGSFSLSNLAPKMIHGDDQPGFYIKHFIKDMKIAIEAAEEMGLDTPALKLAKSLYEKLAENGEEDHGTQALIKYYLGETKE